MSGLSEVKLSPLGTDGSALYTAHGYKVLASVNGPMEVGRRDEVPHQATLIVQIRPAVGVSAIRERALERDVEETLRHVILLAAMPRSLVHITLQVMSSRTFSDSAPKVSFLPFSASCIDLIPALLQAAMLALLTSSIPLSTTLSAVLIAIHGSNDRLITHPSQSDLDNASSVHAVAYTSGGKIALLQSQGRFTPASIVEVRHLARSICLEQHDVMGQGNAPSKNPANTPCLQQQLRDTLEATNLAL